MPSSFVDIHTLWRWCFRLHDFLNKMDEVLQHMDITYMDVILQSMGWPQLQWVVVFSCDTTTYFLGA